MSLTAFVTGSTGFLGRHLCHQLHQSGWQVTAMCRSIPENSLDGVNYVQADLTDQDSLVNAIPENVSCLFHTAADTNTWSKHNARQTQTNVIGTINLLQAAYKANTQKFIYVSSISTFGVEHKGLIDFTEEVPQEGLESWVNYIKTKSLAEQMVKDQAKKLNALVVNPTHIVGPDDQHNWVRLFKMMIDDNLPTIPVGSGSFVDVRDVAQGCILAAEKGKVGENYILGGNNLNFEQFIDQAAEVFGLKVTKRHKPMILIKIVAKLQAAIGYLTGKEPDLTPESLKFISHHYKTNSQKAKDQLGYQIRPLAQSLEDIKENLVDRGILSKP